MKTLPILACALVLGAAAAAGPANARAWSRTGFMARNHMTDTPAAPGGVGSEIGLAGSGSPATATIATSGETLASISGSGSENRPAVTAFAARQTGSQVAATTPAPSVAGVLR